MKRYPYVIVGASIAGLSATGAIRSRDSAGPILLIHGENRLPYKRTQLSKRLARGFSGDELALYPQEWYPARKVELLQGIRGVFVEPSSRELSLSTGEVIGYESLLVATGAAPTIVNIPGSQYLSFLRWIEQAEAMAHRARGDGNGCFHRVWSPGHRNGRSIQVRGNRNDAYWISGHAHGGSSRP